MCTDTVWIPELLLVGLFDYGHLPPGCRTDLGSPYVNCLDL